MRRGHLLGLAAALAAVGLAIFFYKVERLGFPLAPQEKIQVWTVEARADFRRSGVGPVKASLRIPHEPPGFDVIRENFVSRGYGLATSEAKNVRIATWSKRRTSGEQSLYYQVTVAADPDREGRRDVPTFPDIPELEEPRQSALMEIVERARGESADIATFTSAVLRGLNEESPDETLSLLLDGVNGSFQRAALAVTILAGARIPAEVAQAVVLRDQRESSFVPMLAVHNGEEWLYFNPVTGDRGRSPRVLIWTWGSEPAFTTDRGSGRSVTLTVRRSLGDAMEVAERRAELSGSRIVDFSTLSLPLDAQELYRVLLMLPLGAFLIIIMRNFVGVQTFGTFMPILIALAFRETKLGNGILLFVIVVSVGLLIRLYLEKLHLLLVPRLASVFTVVVLVLLAISILSHRLGVETGLSVALFPMVILTMVIERMSIVWEERGAGDAVKEGFGTLVVASLAYVLMGQENLEHLMFVFPELLLVLLAVMLLAGRYTGYRLSELFRFKAIYSGIPSDKSGGPGP